MSVDLLVVRKNQDSENFSHQSGLRVMAACSVNLAELAESLGVKPLEDFFDPARAEFEFYEKWHGEEAPEGWLEEHAQWFAPGEALRTLRAFIDYYERGGPGAIIPKVEPLGSLGGMEAADGLNDSILDFYMIGNAPSQIEVEDLLTDLKECLKMLQIIDGEKDLFCFEAAV